MADRHSQSPIQRKLGRLGIRRRRIENNLAQAPPNPVELVDDRISRMPYKTGDIRGAFHLIKSDGALGRANAAFITGKLAASSWGLWRRVHLPEYAASDLDPE